MGILSRFPFGDPEWSIGKVEPPWGSRPSIYGCIVAHIRPGQEGLTGSSEDLPDESQVREKTGFGWLPGALDGAFGHHVGGDTAEDIAREAAAALKAVTRKATSARARALYDILTGRSAMDFLDPLLERLVADNTIDPARLHAVAYWLATEAADREAVKVALGLLGMFRGDQDRDLLLTVGRHEEFTLYAVVALQNAAAAGERDLWELCKHVRGWGRIHIIERLADTQDEHIRAWMLREGYSNSVMNEYTALICARTGGLLDALRLPHPDEPLLKGAGDIICALIAGRGAPAEGMESYSDGAEVAEVYLRHLQERQVSLEQFVIVGTITSFLEEEEGEVHDPALVWPQRRPVLLDLAGRILSKPDWEERVWSGLSSPDQAAFWTATQAASVLQLDIWQTYFERLQQGADHWFHVMQTNDPERIERVLALADDRLPLEVIATGPGAQLGLGPEFGAHSALDFILQDLRRFPGTGWRLIRVGLRSPVIRNRNMAIRALAAWNRQNWPAEAVELLNRAVREEPNDDTRELLAKLLAGEPLGF